MKKAELVKYFKSRYPAVDEGGGVWFFTLKDDEIGYLGMCPKLRQTSTYNRVAAQVVMCPRWFEELTGAIFKSGRGSYLFTKGDGNLLFDVVGEVTDVHLAQLTDMAFDWFNQCCTEEVIRPELLRKYEIYNRPGGWQFTHIIACVLKGDAEKLRGYLDAFKRGDRMEFIPIIQQEYFERAIPLAEKYRSGELVSPVQF